MPNLALTLNHSNTLITNHPYLTSMKRRIQSFVVLLLLSGSLAHAQGPKDPVVENIVKEATENSQLEVLAHELLDGIGPRLVGTPEMQKAHDWAVAKYKTWGIEARNEKWGEWRGWQPGVTNDSMIHPRVQSLDATQLAWSPGTKGKGVTAELVIIPDVQDSIAFQRWLPAVKGKLVMISMNQPTGRPEYNWEEFATKESLEKMKETRKAATDAWNERIRKTGYNTRTLPAALEKAGAAGIVTSNWTGGFGVNKIFGAYPKRVP